MPRSREALEKPLPRPSNEAAELVAVWTPRDWSEPRLGGFGALVRFSSISRLSRGLKGVDRRGLPTFLRTGSPPLRSGIKPDWCGQGGAPDPILDDWAVKGRRVWPISEERAETSRQGLAPIIASPPGSDTVPMAWISDLRKR